MAKTPTLKDVARAAGVSLGTASRVVNRADNVSPAIRNRVDQAIAELGFRPNLMAQSMRRGVSRTVGVLVRDITVPSLASFVTAVEAGLGEDGYAILLASTGDRAAREIDLLRLFAQRQVDGLIMTTGDETDPALIEARRAVGAPTILLDRIGAGGEDCLTVAHADGLDQAVRALGQLGHRRIGLITGSAQVHPGRDRIEGYRRGHEASGLSVDPRLIRTEGFGDESGWLAASALLDLPDRPTALIAGSSSMLAGVLRAVRARGLTIPDDLSLIAGSDSDLAALVTPSISVVRWSYDQLGRAAAALLVGRLNGDIDSASRRLISPAELVLRNSCGPVPA
jgi:LacI family transcriptional regulator